MDAIEWLLGLALVATVPAYWVMQFRMLRAYRGGWRIAAAVPLVAMILLGVVGVLAVVGGSDLGPLLLVFSAPFTLVYLVAVWALHRRLARGAVRDAA